MRDARRSVSFLLPILVLAFPVLGCQPSGRTWQRIESSGVLRVGLDPTYPPFELADGLELEGLDVDLARAVADDLGLEAEFVFTGYDGLYDALGTKQVDVLISALVIAPERTRDFAYTESYFNAGEILVTGTKSEDIDALENMNGRDLAVELGAQGHVEATKWSRRLSDLGIQTYNTADQALAAVAAGKADAALVDAVSGRLYLINTPGLEVSPQPVTVEPYAIVVRKEDEVLLQKLNEQLDRLKRSGRLDEIISEWLGETEGN